MTTAGFDVDIHKTLRSDEGRRFELRVRLCTRARRAPGRA
jgi:hypothetical protein